MTSDADDVTVGEVGPNYSEKWLREFFAGLLARSVAQSITLPVKNVEEPPNAFADHVIFRNGAVLSVHPRSACEPPCAVHAPSDHALRDAPLQWRADRQLFERVCEHGVGHPDPDDIRYRRVTRDDAAGVHGCCANECCRR